MHHATPYTCRQLHMRLAIARKKNTMIFIENFFLTEKKEKNGKKTVGHFSSCIKLSGNRISHMEWIKRFCSGVWLFDHRLFKLIRMRSLNIELSKLITLLFHCFTVDFLSLTFSCWAQLAVHFIRKRRYAKANENNVVRVFGVWCLAFRSFNVNKCTLHIQHSLYSLFMIEYNPKPVSFYVYHFETKQFVLQPPEDLTTEKQQQ